MAGFDNLFGPGTTGYQQPAPMQSPGLNLTAGNLAPPATGAPAIPGLNLGQAPTGFPTGALPPGVLRAPGLAGGIPPGLQALLTRPLAQPMAPRFDMLRSRLGISPAGGGLSPDMIMSLLMRRGG